MSDYYNIGRLVATFGIKGELVLRHSLGKKTAMNGLETVFIEEKKDELLPYFIESTRIKNDSEIYLKLEGINAKEPAQQLVQKQIWLAADDFHKFAGRSAPISLLGYHVLHQGEDLGEILEVIEQPHQLLCRIELNGKEVLLPVHSETLQKVDKNKKQVFLDLPDGLLDVFLK
jgi:16S rRNA processing protein RimM